jgi:hypothetical protein
MGISRHTGKIAHPFVSIHNGRWEIHLDGEVVHTFPESGVGLMEFFRLHNIREVMCSSSVDFPKEESTLNAKQANEILTTALAWEAIPELANKQREYDSALESEARDCETKIGEIQQFVADSEHFINTMNTREIRSAYGEMQIGNHITDEQIDLLSKTIGDAMPFLQASPAFSLVLREARTNLDTLERYKRARKGGFYKIS